MLIGATADFASVLHRALAVLSTVCCLFLLTSFALFARDQAAGASQHQQTAELPAAPVPAPAQPAPHKHAQPRRFIDGVAHALTSPFSSIVQSSNDWVTHGIPTVLALVVYGLGLSFLARFSRDVT
jgi:hypothetical protein